MTEKKTPVLERVEAYILARDITPDYADKVRYAWRRFLLFLNTDPGIEGVSCEPVNKFLAYLQGEGLRPDTVAGYKRAIMAVWNDAYEAGDNHNAPLRVRKIRTPRDPVDAFTHAEIKSLLTVAEKLTGYFPNGVKRSDFWTGIIHAAYSTGLRRGDLLRVKRSQIGPSGILRIRQNKTGYPITVRFSKPALAAINRMVVDRDPQALPWPYHANALSRQFRKLVKAARIRPGQWRWLRRSAGSYAESVTPGTGMRCLGHRTLAVFSAHYDDQSISAPNPVTPPEIPRMWRPPKVSLYKQESGIFEMRYTDPHTKKGVRKSTGTVDEAEAELQRERLENELREQGRLVLA